MTTDTTDTDDTEVPTGLAERVDGAEVVSLLQDLVRIESPYFEEGEIVDFVHGWFTDAGLNPERHPVVETEYTGYEGDNVLVRVEGHDPEAPTLLLNAHVDTVQLVDEWEEDPLSGRVEDGKLYGQGACDMKGGLAAAMVATRELATADADTDLELAGDLLFTAVVDEEGPYGLGTDRLVRDGVVDECDAAVVTEPGPLLAQSDVENPALLLGARGRFLLDIEVRGEAAHGSQPHRGTNAITDAGLLADALAEMDTGDHPDLGSGSVCPIGVDGGGVTLSVPEQCRLVVDRHVVPGETAAVVREEVRAVVDDLDLDADVSVRFREGPEGARYGPYVTDRDHPLVGALADGARATTGRDPEFGYFASVGDFNYLGDRADLPTVIVGPDGGNIHGAGEYVYTDEVVEVTELLVDGLTRYLGHT